MTQIKNDDLTEVVSIIIKEIIVQKEIVKGLNSQIESTYEKLFEERANVSNLTNKIKELEKELSETKELITPGNVVGALMKEASKKPRGPYKKREKGGIENENTGA